MGTCTECRNYRTCNGAAVGGSCSPEESLQITEEVARSDAPGGTATLNEVPRATTTYNTVGHSYEPPATAAEEVAIAPEELDQSVNNNNAEASEPIVDIVIVGSPGDARRIANERAERRGQRYVALLQRYNRNLNRDLNERWRPNENTPDDIEEAIEPEANDDSAPP